MLTIDDLLSKDQTGHEMYRIINNYSADLNDVFVKRNGKLIPLSNLSILEMFDVVRKIPYRRDIHNIEVVARPIKILASSPAGMDCKKKSILMSSFCKENKIPFRLIASSRRPDRKVHHVFPQGFLSGMYRNLDATYPHYKPFEDKQVTAAEVLSYE
jgi:hypothetical protein